MMDVIDLQIILAKMIALTGDAKALGDGPYLYAELGLEKMRAKKIRTQKGDEK